MLPGVLRRLCRAWRLAALGAVVLGAGLLAGSFGGTAGAQQSGPTISSVSVSSSPANALFYLTGETIRFSVNFTSVVDVEGSPTLAVDVGGTEREAGFESVRGSAVLFGYTLTDDDFDGDGVSVAADSLSLGTGGAIADSGDRAASLTHVAVAAGAAHRVNMSVVTIAADSDEPVPENETAGFTLSRTGSLARELTVSLQFERRQYFVLTFQIPRTAKLQAGQATARFEVPLRNDSDLETEDGSLTMIVAEGPGYLVGSPGSAVAVQTDDNDILLGLVLVQGGDLVEGGSRSQAIFGVTVQNNQHARDRPPDPIALTVATRNIETTSTRDPSLSPGDIRTLATEFRVQSEEWKTRTSQDTFGRPLRQYFVDLDFLVTILDDLEPEIPERFRVIVERSAVTYPSTFSQEFPLESVYRIIDNEGSFDVHVDQPRVVDIVEGDVLELDLTAVSQFRFNPLGTTSVEVDLEFVDGTATHMDDFVQLDRSTATTETVEITGFATVGTGDAQRHQAASTVRISAVDNNDVQPVREFVVDFGKTPIAPDDQDFDADECSGDPLPDTPACYGQNHYLDFFPADLDGDAGLAGYSMVVRIHDDDATPVAVAADESSIDEGENAVFTVTRNPSAADLPDPLTVGFDITETADFIDYSGGFVLPTSVTIAANATTATITVPTVDDNVGDGPGEIAATLRPGTVEPQSRYSYTLAGRTASVAVSEDEPAMTIADASVSEGAGAVDLVVTLSGTSAEAVGFTWATAPATGDRAATAGLDYQSAGGTVQIDAGDTSATLTVTITDDALDEFDNETFHVVLSAVTGASVAQPQATVTVADNDALPEFSISDAAATEGPGASVGFTVSLDAASGRPTGVRWRAVSDEDDDRPATEDFDYQGIGATLTIPAGETEATVSVQLLDDGDHEPTETFEVGLANPTNSVIADGTGEGRILDDDTPTISIDDLSVSESAATAQVTVRLSRPAYDEVTLRYGTAAGTAIATMDYTAQSQVAVTIPAGATTATVAVPILADDVYEADESFFVDLSDPAVAELGSDRRAVITIVDDDSPPALSVGDAQPVAESSGPLVFTVTRTGSTSLPATFSWSTADVTAEAGSDFTAASGTVTIPAASSSAQLQVQLVSDSVAEDDETVAVTLSTPINAVIIDGSATGVILDDDQTAARTPGVVVDPSALTVTEGDATGVSYMVELSSQPAADVTVAIVGHSGTDLTLSATDLSSDYELTFTTANWNTAQTVTVNAGDDDDAVADAAVTLTHTATSGSHSSAPVAVTVTITETDTAEVLAVPGNLTVAEDGSSTYTVALATQPSANVTVTVTGHTGSDLTLSAARLTFTPDNWGTPQTVTVTADADADGVDDQVTLTNTASGGGYGAAAAKLVAVTVTDDDAAAIVVKPPALTMSEGGSSSYTVELSSPPTAEVTVTVSAPEADLTILSPDPRTLRFTPEDWDQPQTVTLAAGYDADTTDDPVTLTHTGEGGGYDGQSTELPVTVTDVESRAELLVAPTSISIREGDSDGQTYSVALGSQPTGDVTVTITGHAGSDLTLAGAALTSDALTFTVTNWNTAQEVTVTAGPDPDTANDDETLTNTATGGGYGTATAATVAVTIVDNDTPGLVVTPTEVRVTEGDDAGASYQISLASAPTGLVLVTITSNSTDVDVTDGVWFTTTDWGNPQTITVTASDDPDLTDENVRLNHTVTSGSYAASAVRVQVTVEDDDMPGLVVNPQTLSMIEGASATYDIELTAEPSADVTVTISGHADTDLTLSGTGLSNDDMLTFTANNWNQAQSVTATAGQDSDTTDDTATLTHMASGGGYDSLEPVGAPVTVIDDDRPRINVPAAVTVVEADADGVVYAVRLTTEPSADVTVTISGHADSDVTLSGDTLTNNTLTFTRSIQTTLNWGAPQTVTVTGGDDDDTANESVVLTHTATGGDYAGLTAQVEVTVVDDDEPEIILSDSEVTIDEADPDGAVYEVRLATEPSQQVEVEIIAAVGTDLVRTPEVLTFDSSSWNTAQAVKVTAPPDVDTMHEEELIVHLGIGGEYEGTTKTVTVIVQDDDIPPGVTIDPTELTVTEGAVDLNGDPVTATYTVVLTTQPTADVVVTVAGHADGGDVTVNSSTSAVDLTFTALDWSAAQTVTVAAADDSVAEGSETVTLTHTVKDADSAAEYAEVTVASVTVTVQDDDAVGVMIAPTTLTVTEGDATGVSYSVKLTSEPAGDVTVTVSGHSGTDLTLSAAVFTDNVLTFTTANWDMAQTVTVKAAEDDDAVTDAAVTLAHAVASTDDSAYDALEDLSVSVAITENDAVGVVIAPTQLTVAEGDATGVSYSVKLTSEPAGDVTVTVSGHSGTDVALSGTTLTSNVLTFTTVNWATAQTVTVKAAEDDDAVTDTAVTLAHAVASTDDSAYDALSDLSVSVAITENDAVGVEIDPTELTVAEGSSMDYTVKLTSEPAGDVVVTVSGHADSGATLSGTSLSADDELTFTTGNWSTAQTVTVTGTDDDTAEANETVTLAHAVASTDDSAYDALSDLSVTVTVEDDDSVGVEIDPTELTVAEGSSMDYTVKLTSEPAGDVVVTVSGHADSGATLSGTSLSADDELTFTTGNWSTAQTVTVTGTDDDTAEANETVTLAHAVASADDSAYDALSDVSVTVTVEDDDSVGVEIAPTTLTVTEGDATGVGYTVVLTSEPAGDVTVTISGHSGTDLSIASAGLSGDDELTFTTANWATAQTVKVTAAEDGDAVADADVTLAHAIASADDTDYDALADVEVTVSITDNDSVGVMIAPTTLTVTEGDATGVGYTVVLTSEPAGDVTVTISGHSGTDLSIASAGLSGDDELTFTTANWATAQTVKVTAAEDGDAVADADVTLAHAIASADDTDYDALADVEVTVSITDNDSVGVMIAPTTLTVTEGDATGVGYTVVLTSEPAGDVTVTISGHSGTDLSIASAGLSGDDELTFTTANWATAQTVKVTAAEDGDAVADADVTLAHAIASADDTDYDALADVEVTVSITDNDSVGVMIAPTTLTVTEGDATGVGYTVVLTSEPAGDVTVTISGHSGTDLSIASAGLSGDDELTFTTANWATAQTVKVTAAEDGDAVADADVTLAHAIASADDTDYDALADVEVTVSITDNDSVGVMIAPTTLTVTEGDATGVGYTVVLTSEPAGDVTVTISGHSGTDLSIASAGLSGDDELTFTTANWATAQTVKVTAAEDGDAVADADVTLAHAIASADDTDYDALADVEVTVSITDDDSVGVMIAPTTLTVTEGDATGVGYTVVLTSEPAGDVTVTISGHSGTDLSIASAGLSGDDELTFTTANWATAQTVKVTAAEDGDAVADADVTLAHAIASADDTDYDALADVEVTVSITDNDAAGVTLSPTTLTVTEGDATGVGYTVVLTSQPAGDVTVTISGHSGTDLSIASAGLSGDDELTFTAANWATAQTVKVTAAEDGDAVADADVTLAHAIASADDTDYDALADVEVTVSITDNDAAGVMIAPTTLTVTEGDATGVGYTVVLTSEPAGDVTVAISGQSGTDVSVSGATLTGGALTFTDSNWSAAQTLKVTAAADDDATSDSDVVLVHAISSDDDSAYDALADKTVTVTITEKDAVEVVIDPEMLTVLEGDAAGQTYTVKLASQPAGDVTVAISGQSGTDVAVSGATLTGGALTFTDSNWSAAQTLKVTAAADDDATSDSDVVLVHAISSDDDSAYDALADKTVTVTITEKDAVEVVIDPEMLTVLEGDAAGQTYTVKLASQPAGDVTVTVSGHAGTGAAVSGTTLTNNVLTFTTGNWDMAQTVTVTGTDDSTAEGDETVTLAHAVASTDDSAYDALSDVSVTVTVEDNDTVGVSIDPTTLTVAEGSSMDYSVKLTSQPAGDVTVTVSGHAGSGASLSGTSLSADNVLTFTTANWDMAQTVTVTGTDDSTAEADETVTLAHAVASTDDTAYNALSDLSVTVTVEDNDSVGVMIDPTELTVAEGSSKSYTVKLTSEPAGDVTVTVSGHAGTDVALSGMTLTDNVLTFTAMNWSTAQTVTVTAAEDDDAVTDADVTLVHAVASTDDTAYNALSDLSVSVAITENDAVGVTVSFEKDFHRTSEGAFGGAFATVRLSAASQTEVTIPIEVSSTTTAGTNDYRLSTQPFQDAPNYAAVPVSGTFDVTFEAGDSAVYFAIRALPDTVFENDEKVVLEFGALPAGISTGSPSATTFHLIDTQTVSFGANSYSAIEGGPGATVTVSLDYAPAASAIVCLVVENQAGTSDDDYADVPDELVFAVTDTSRSFVVTVADDADSDGGSIMIGFGCLSGEFREGSPSSTTVNLLDDDPPGGNPGAEGLPAPRGLIATFLTFDGHYYNKTQNSITLLWFPLDRAVQYKLEHRKTADGGDWTVVAGDFEEYTGGGDGPVAVAAGLECDTEYDFRLSAAAAENTDASGFGDYAETRARTGPCPEPDLVTNMLVAMTPACATLHWTAPLDGRAVAYRVQRTDLGQQPAVTATLTASTAGTTFRHCPSGGYPPGSGYLFWVAALTTDAEVYGENYSQIVNAGPKGPPNVARNLRFTRQGPQVRSLAWDPPANVWLTTVREATANDGYSNEVADPWVSYVVQRAELEPDSVPGHETLVDGTWHDLGEATGTTFTDRENIGDRIFVYRVLTRNSSGFADGYDPEIWMER